MTQLLVILYGPSGSGKTSMIDYAIKKYNIENPIKILIDSIIMNNENYKKATTEIIDDYDKSKLNYNSANLEILDKQLEQSLYNIYDTYRKSKNGDLLSDSLLKRSLEKKRNIIYEGTGKNTSIEWLIYVSKLANEQNYKIVVLFPFVTINRLTERVKFRFGKLPEKEPRIINKDELNIMYGESINNFNKLINCSYINEITIVDNNYSTIEYEILFSVDESIITCSNKLFEYLNATTNLYIFLSSLYFI